MGSITSPCSASTRAISVWKAASKGAGCAVPRVLIAQRLRPDDPGPGGLLLRIDVELLQAENAGPIGQTATCQTLSQSAHLELARRRGRRVRHPRRRDARAPGVAANRPRRAVSTRPRVPAADRRGKERRPCASGPMTWICRACGSSGLTGDTRVSSARDVAPTAALMPERGQRTFAPRHDHCTVRRDPQATAAPPADLWPDRTVLPPSGQLGRASNQAWPTSTRRASRRRAAARPVALPLERGVGRSEQTARRAPCRRLQALSRSVERDGGVRRAPVLRSRLRAGWAQRLPPAADGPHPATRDSGRAALKKPAHACSRSRVAMASAKRTASRAWRTQYAGVSTSARAVPVKQYPNRRRYRESGTCIAGNARAKGCSIASMCGLDGMRAIRRGAAPGSPRARKSLCQRQHRRLIAAHCGLARAVQTRDGDAPATVASVSWTSASLASRETIAPPRSESCISRPRALTSGGILQAEDAAT